MAEEDASLYFLVLKRARRLSTNSRGSLSGVGLVQVDLMSGSYVSRTEARPVRRQAGVVQTMDGCFH